MNRMDHKFAPAILCGLFSVPSQLLRGTHCSVSRYFTCRSWRASTSLSPLGFGGYKKDSRVIGVLGGASGKASEFGEGGSVMVGDAR